MSLWVGLYITVADTYGHLKYITVADTYGHLKYINVADTYGHLKYINVADTYGHLRHITVGDTYGYLNTSINNFLVLVHQNTPTKFLSECTNAFYLPTSLIYSLILSSTFSDIYKHRWTYAKLYNA